MSLLSIPPLRSSVSPEQQPNEGECVLACTLPADGPEHFPWHVGSLLHHSIDRDSLQVTSADRRRQDETNIASEHLEALRGYVDSTSNPFSSAVSRKISIGYISRRDICFVRLTRSVGLDASFAVQVLCSLLWLNIPAKDLKWSPQ